MSDANKRIDLLCCFNWIVTIQLKILVTVKKCDILSNSTQILRW